jgi:hypothetical protein
MLRAILELIDERLDLTSVLRVHRALLGLAELGRLRTASGRLAATVDLGVKVHSCNPDEFANFQRERSARTRSDHLDVLRHVLGKVVLLAR